MTKGDMILLSIPFHIQKIKATYLFCLPNGLASAETRGGLGCLCLTEVPFGEFKASSDWRASLVYTLFYNTPYLLMLHRIPYC